MPLAEAAVAALSGAPWARTLRLEALARLAAMTPPTDADEIWRYSRINALQVDRYPMLAGAATDVIVPGSAAGKVRVDTLASLDHDPDGDTASSPGDYFTTLSTAALTDLTVIDVPHGVVIEEPILVNHHVTADGSLAGSRLIVRLGADAEATIIERWTSADVSSLVLPVTEIDLAETSRLRHVSVQSMGEQMTHLALCATRTARDATLRSLIVALGGGYARSHTHAQITGKGGFNELLAVFFGSGSQMHDFRTTQDHAAPNTRSELVFKGAVTDKAASVYSGLIRIARDAKGSIANQTNRNLLLSAGAQAESVPNLEILNNDVRCSHASAIGPIDEDQRYYLESRGVHPQAAERLIVLGFFDDLLERVPVPSLRAELIDAVRHKLDSEPGRSARESVA